MSHKLVWIGVALLAIGFNGVGAAATDGGLSMEPFVFEAQGQKVEAERGWLTVPETHFEETANEIRLPIVRFRSTSPNPGPPLLYFAGGPGGSGIGTAKSVRFHLFMKLREACDVIVFDQRGTGAAEPSLIYNERWELPLDKPADFDAWTPLMRDWLKTCVESFADRDIHLKHYNTRENAADVNALREALGVEKIALWGTSYGTHLSMAMLRYYGEHVSRVILTGAEGPDHTLKLPSTTQLHLEKVAELVANNDALSRVIPDFMAMVRTELDKLEAKPAVVRIGRDKNIVVGRVDLAMYISQSVGRARSIRTLPLDLHRISQGKYGPLARFALSIRTEPINSGMSLAMDCASGASVERIDRILKEAQETVLGDTVNFPFDIACEGCGIPKLGTAFRDDLRSDVPALFISGELDGRTPIANAEEIRKGFSESYHLIVDGTGHDESLFSLAPQLDKRMLTFLRGEKPSEDRLSVPLEFAPIKVR